MAHDLPIYDNAHFYFSLLFFVVNSSYIFTDIYSDINFIKLFNFSVIFSPLSLSLNL